jgi:hypothetical protein
LFDLALVNAQTIHCKKNNEKFSSNISAKKLQKGYSVTEAEITAASETTANRFVV